MTTLEYINSRKKAYCGFTGIVDARVSLAKELIGKVDFDIILVDLISGIEEAQSNLTKELKLVDKQFLESEEH